jgi:hypothetical protein
MNPTTVVTIAGLVRHLLTLFGGATLLGDADILGDQTVDHVVGAVSTIVGVGWSMWTKLSKKAPAAVVPAPGVGQ